MDATETRGYGPCDIGRILSRDDITTQLIALRIKQNLAENNNSLFGPAQSNKVSATPLDDPVDEAVAQDILAVQLPPKRLRIRLVHICPPF